MELHGVAVHGDLHIDQEGISVQRKCTTMGGGKRAPTTPNSEKTTSGLSPATPQRTQAHRVRSQDRSPATGQPAEDGPPSMAGRPLPPVPWELSEMSSEDDARSPTTMAKDVDKTGGFP